MSRQTHDSIVPPLSHAVPTLALPSTAQPSLVPLWGIDPALRPVQQQQQTQIPFWPKQQQVSNYVASLLSVTDMANALMATGDGKPDSTDLTRNDITRHQHGMRRQLDLWVSGTGGNLSGKGFQGGCSATMEITDRDPIPKWDF